MVEILMGVYNGEKYISKQIESILNQTYSDWHLTIRDDASTDGTWDILQKFKSILPDKIRCERNETNSGSPKENFFRLISGSEEEYWMTCDHDDVWLEDKISITLSEMKRLEKEGGEDLPLLVHTDLRVVDEELKTISPSMIRAQKLNPNGKSLSRLLVQNNVTGCTMMGNRKLREMVKTLPEEALMHDWYYALVAAAFGKIGFANEQTILYRQHGDNQVGAKEARKASYAVQRFSKSYEVRKAVYRTYEQAEAFLNQFESALSEPQKEMVLSYAQMPEKGKLAKINTLRKYNLWKYGALRRIGQMLYA